MTLNHTTLVKQSITNPKLYNIYADRLMKSVCIQNHETMFTNSMYLKKTTHEKIIKFRNIK